MKKIIYFLGYVLLVSLIFFSAKKISQPQSEGAPPYDTGDDLSPFTGRYPDLAYWKRPDGPAKVGLQAGHWKNDELPEELDRLKGSTGSSGGGKSEWEVNLKIAEATAGILRKNNIQVDVLPATVPAGYWADVFVAIHADGSTDTTKSGFKLASGRRDFSGKAKLLNEKIEKTYALNTGLTLDPNITRQMRGYYAFGWWRFEYAIHPMTTAAILESGFLTSPADRDLLINKTDLIAQGIAEGIINYLNSQSLLN